MLSGLAEDTCDSTESQCCVTLQDRVRSWQPSSCLFKDQCLLVFSTATLPFLSQHHHTSYIAGDHHIFQSPIGVASIVRTYEAFTDAYFELDHVSHPPSEPLSSTQAPNHCSILRHISYSVSVWTIARCRRACISGVMQSFTPCDARRSKSPQ